MKARPPQNLNLFTKLRVVKHQPGEAPNADGTFQGRNAAEEEPSRGRTVIRTIRRSSALKRAELLKRNVTRPGLEPGISGSGGRRLIH